MDNSSSIFEIVSNIENEGDICCLCTIVSSNGSTPRHIGSKMIVKRNGTLIGSVGGGEIEKRVIDAAREVSESGKPQLIEYHLVNPEKGDPGVCGGTVQVFIDPINPKPQLIVIGGGHVGKAVVHLGKWLGFKIIISDDRPEFCTPEIHPDADILLPILMSEIPSHIKINSSTYIVLTTRGAGIDIPGLPILLETEASYIGVIGSQRRWILTQKGMIDAGVQKSKIERIKSPIGIDIKAESPEELAISILAEIILHKNNKESISGSI